MSSEWYLDVFHFQKVFKQTIINQKHDYHGGQFLFKYVSDQSTCPILLQVLRGSVVEILGLGVRAKYHNTRR